MTAPAAVVSGDCPHENWQATATLYRDGPNTGSSVVLEMACVECLTPMVWESAETTSPTAVAVAIRLPCRPFKAEIGGGAS